MSPLPSDWRPWRASSQLEGRRPDRSELERVRHRGSGRDDVLPYPDDERCADGRARADNASHPSGLNAHETVDSLAEHWRTVWDAANTGDESDQPYETNGQGCSALGEDEQG